MVAAGTTWIIASSHFLSLDIGLAFFLTLALCAFVIAQHDGTGDDERRRAMWVTWAAMAGATLSKGLVGVLIPGATLVLYSLLNRQWAFWRRMHWGTGLPLFLALTAPWFVAVSLRNPDFFEFFFIHEHFQRYLTDEAQRLGAPWYFVPILLVGFLPWTTTLPALARLGARRDDSQSFQPLRLLLIWSVFVFVFFSVSHSKLPSYILPMFPALALLAAAWLERVDATRLSRHLLLPVAGCLLHLAIAPFSDRFATHDTPAEILRPMALMMALGAALFVAAAAVAWQALAPRPQERGDADRARLRASSRSHSR
ncbi:MAG: phospholipid carrier-dependent glycosyltransferase [Burkholderiaceae bacterium]